MSAPISESPAPRRSSRATSAGASSGMRRAAVGGFAVITDSSLFGRTILRRPSSDRTQDTAIVSTVRSLSTLCDDGRPIERRHANTGMPTLLFQCVSIMSQKTVQLVIGRLLTDEELREQF